MVHFLLCLMYLYYAQRFVEHGVKLNWNTATLSPKWGAFKDVHSFYKKLEDLKLDVICGTLKVIPPAEWKQPSPKNYAKDVLGDVIVDKPLKPTFTTIYEGGGTFISEAKSRISVENGKKVPVDQPI